MNQTFEQWCEEFRKIMGWTKPMIRGNRTVLRMDFEDGNSPEYAAECWKLGYDPNGAAFKAVGKLMAVADAMFGG